MSYSLDSNQHTELQHPSIKRAKDVDHNSYYQKMLDLLKKQEEEKQSKVVLHWFRNKDLRIQDNCALYYASQQAKKNQKGLISLYTYCPKELIQHGTSPARIDFILETLKKMQVELKALNIPLVILTIEKRENIVSELKKFLQRYEVSHLYANYEYEVNELKRDIQLIHTLQKEAVVATFYHDQSIVEPGTITTSNDKPLKVFTPYHKVWVKRVKENTQLLKTFSTPDANSKEQATLFAKFFDQKIPNLPQEKKFLSLKKRDDLRKLWPAGHDAGIKRMKNFIKYKLVDYTATRSEPAADSGSRMSVYLSSGAVSAREIVALIKTYNKSSDFSEKGSSEGVFGWMREIVFRELNRQTLMTTPHISMNLPKNLKFDFVEWEKDEEGWKRWCEGKTGVPFIDAGMRQLNQEAYMHNRLRMNVASYCYGNLLIDYRIGERYFAEKLIDWDLANNTLGWEPSFTIFNPIMQAERNDPNGDYIRKWVPELQAVKGKAIFDPYHRLSPQEFEKLGYPKPYLNWEITKTRAIQRFKEQVSTASL